MTQITAIQNSLKQLNSNETKTQTTIKDILSLTIKEHNKERMRLQKCFSSEESRDFNNKNNEIKMKKREESGENEREIYFNTKSLTFNSIKIEENKSKNTKALTIDRESKVFDCGLSKVINIKAYLKRIIESSEIESSTLIYSIALLKHFIRRTNVLLTVGNVYSLLFTSMLVSLKLNEDLNFTYDNYALIGGFDIKQLTVMENTFLNLIGFDIILSEDYFVQCAGLFIGDFQRNKEETKNWN